METYKDVIIIGAGQSGLACSYYLSRTPLTHLVLERRNASFSTWRSLWDSFHTISTKFLLDLPGLGKIEGDDDELISRDQLLDHFERWTALWEPNVSYGVNVRSVKEAEDGVIAYSVTDDKRNIYHCRHLIIASGYESDPYLPSWVKDNRQLYHFIPRTRVSDTRPTDGIAIALHSTQYCNPSQVLSFGRDVVVIGSGLSGTKIAKEIAQHVRDKDMKQRVVLCVGSSKQSSVRSHRGRDMMFFIRERKLLDQPVPAPTLPIHEDNKASGIEGNSRASTESSSEEAGTILDKAMSNVATVGETLADFAARLAPHLLLCPRPVGVSSSSESAELLLQTVDHLEEVLEGQRTAINTQRKMFDQLIDSHFSHLEWEPPLADVPAASSPLKALNSSIHHKNSLCIGDKVLIFATGYVPSFRQFLPLQYMHWQCIGDIRQSHGRVQMHGEQTNMWVVGLPRLRSGKSGLIQGMMEDAEHVVGEIVQALEDSG